MSGIISAIRRCQLAFIIAMTGVSRQNLDATSFTKPLSVIILCKLLILWSGRPGSNRRRPAWETCRCL